MRALLLVDIQNDFLPGGALAVPRGDEIIPLANRLIPHYEVVVATQDWHPANHVSFASQHLGHKPGDVVVVEGVAQILWPDHCIPGTPGAELAPGLNRHGIQHLIHKGTRRELDSYSGFFDNARRHKTPLEDCLLSHGVNELHIMGLATDYCVKATALDAVQLGFRGRLLTDGIRGVELTPGDCQRAIDEMRAAGVVVE